MKWTKTKLYWRNKQHDATIQGPCEMGWYRCWVKRAYKICDSLKEAKAWAESIALPNAQVQRRPSSDPSTTCDDHGRSL